MNPKIVMNSHDAQWFFSRRKMQQEKFRSWYQSTYIWLLGIMGFLLIYYVWILNANATQAYEIGKLEDMEKELKENLNRIESIISDVDSLETITAGDMYKNMVPADDPDYLVVKPGAQYVYNY